MGYLHAGKSAVRASVSLHGVRRPSPQLSMGALGLILGSGCSSSVITTTPREAGASAGGASAGGASAGGASAGGASAGGASAGGAPAGGHAGSGSGGSGMGGSAAGGSDAGACSFGLTRCGADCAQLVNDPHHCGACDKACPADAPVCLGSTCVAAQCGDSSSAPPLPPPVCEAGAQCCGNYCCLATEICCSVHRGGASNGLELGCYDPTKSNGTCPVGCPQCVCASPDTPVATPEGERPIADLRVGDLVYTFDHGAMAIAPIVRTNRALVDHHSVMRLVLETGKVLEISPRHPTADGRPFGSLRSDDRLDGVRIASATVVPYSHDATYDILPDSDTGAYFAGGVLIGSTLSDGAALVVGPSVPVSLPRAGLAPGR